MIYCLTGKIVKKSMNAVVLSCGGVGSVSYTHLKSFMTHYPQIELEVYQGTYDDVKEWLRTGQVDIAFLSSTCREEFNLTELFREPLLLSLIHI